MRILHIYKDYFPVLGGIVTVLYLLDRCRYNSRVDGFVGPAAFYDGLQFHGPEARRPGASFAIDGDRLYLAYGDGEQYLLGIYEVPSLALVTTLSLPGRPDDLAVAAGRGRLYLTLDDGAQSLLWTLDRTGQLLDELALGEWTQNTSLALDAAGGRDQVLGLKLGGEYAVNRRFRRFPNQNFAKLRAYRLTDQAGYLTALYRHGPWYAYGEGYHTDTGYGTSAYIADPEGVVENATRSKLKNIYGC